MSNHHSLKSWQRVALSKKAPPPELVLGEDPIPRDGLTGGVLLHTEKKISPVCDLEVIEVKPGKVRRLGLIKPYATSRWGCIQETSFMELGELRELLEQEGCEDE